jgi:NAD(P) transhydrogenase subunit alpha
MKLAFVKETARYESRVAISPDIAKKLIADGYQLAMQAGAGVAAGFPDDAYRAAGVKNIVADAATALENADIVVRVQAPTLDEIRFVPDGVTLVAMMDPYRNALLFDALNARRITTFALELVPRTTRAQSMDVLSSQANLAGYRAVLEAATLFPKAFPMFMTAAGTIAPARVFVMGAGVAGLQAIATAKRLGAIVSATDVRLAAKEQVESLGASFVMVEDDETKAAETAGGYARDMSPAYKAKQAALVAEHIKKQDIVITTALIPGRPAPQLVTDDMIASMKPGSVVVDLAAGVGGNCAGIEPDKIVTKHNVTLVGHTNYAARIPLDASALYAKNMQNFLALIVDGRGPVLNINWADDIVKACGLTHSGKKIHPNFGGVPVAVVNETVL